MRLSGKPIKFSTDLARIVANISCDGHLQLDKRRGLASFYSKNLDVIKRENKRFRKVFLIKGRIYPDKRDDGYKLFFISKEIAKFLSTIGVPVGNKTNKIYSVPSWIINGGKKIKSAYLKGIFNSEASVYKTKNNTSYRWRIHISQYKNYKLKKNGLKYMNQIREILFKFGIRSSPTRCIKGNRRIDGSESIGMQFEIEKSSFSNFIKYVGFENPEKQKKLLIALRGE